jgi:hypothetical protein
MFKYQFSDYLWLYLVAVVAWVLIFGMYRLLKRGTAKNTIVYFLLVAIAFSFLGLTIGIHIGLSESPVIGVIIPALLTFIGGFMLYVFVFTDKSKVQDGFVLLIIMISLCFFLMIGSDYACTVRVNYDAKLQDYLYNQKKDFEYFKSELAKGHVQMRGAPLPASTDSSTKVPVSQPSNSTDQDLFNQFKKQHEAAGK